MRFVRLLAGFCISLCLLSMYTLALVLLWLRRGCQERAMPKPSRRLRILVTGRVNSQNWCRAHLLPLAEAGNVETVLVLMDGPVIDHPKIRSYSLPKYRLGAIRLIARSVRLCAIAIRERPDVIVGFTFFPAAIMSLVAARFAGAAAVYQMTGGSIELSNGGVNRDLRTAQIPDFFIPMLRGLACRICKYFAAIIVRGRRTKDFVMQQTQARHIEIITGAVDPARFKVNGNGHSHDSYDIAFIGRMVPVKQPSHVIEVISRVAKERRQSRAAIVGSGPLLQAAKENVARAGLTEQVDFLGQMEKVEEVLCASKVFLLTSRSEGLSIALAEAMLAGAVPVVADVGDLSDLVENGENGWLIPPGDFDAYAARIRQTLDDDSLRQKLSTNARAAAFRQSALENVVKRWEGCLQSLNGNCHKDIGHEETKKMQGILTAKDTKYAKEF